MQRRSVQQEACMKQNMQSYGQFKYSSFYIACFWPVFSALPTEYLLLISLRWIWLTLFMIRCTNNFNCCLWLSMPPKDGQQVFVLIVGSKDFTHHTYAHCTTYKGLPFSLCHVQKWLFICSQTALQIWLHRLKMSDFSWYETESVLGFHACRAFCHVGSLVTLQSLHGTEICTIQFGMSTHDSVHKT